MLCYCDFSVQNSYCSYAQLGYTNLTSLNSAVARFAPSCNFSIGEVRNEHLSVEECWEMALLQPAFRRG